MSASEVTLGVNAFTPNFSASLLVADRYVGSVEEERFTGPKRAAVWPAAAIASLIDAAGLEANEIKRVALNFDPGAYDTVAHGPSFTAGDIRRRTDAFREARHRLTRRIQYGEQRFPSARATGVNHHRAHATYAWGTATATDEEIRHALAVAQLTDFVNSLPDGVDTHLGVRGATLSGGQRQRVAIARAVLAQPNLLLLDESTSALDGETERDLLLALRSEFADRIVVLITHRPQAAAHATRTLEVKNGRLLPLERV